MRPEVFLKILEQKRHYVGIFLFVTFLVVLGLYIFLQTPPNLSPVTGKLVVEDIKPELPDFTYQNEKKENKQIHSLKGKVLLISFWASWCAPCQVELPMFQTLSEKYDDDDFRIIPLNLDDEREDALSFKKTFWKKHNIEFPTFFDPDKKAAILLDVQGLPTNFLVDKNMNVVFQSTGLQDWNSPEVQNLIDELVR
ncbi:MAG: TlpA family protein disulfide reductase [Bdellovibrionales bacterium]|nr:TlpA family protein disulfide reductase [Bdellovibrionales bacterium]